MKVQISRHAKRRLKLYGIPETIISGILKERNLALVGRQEMIKKVSMFNLPIKIVFDADGDTITVITAYPLKKRRKR